MDWLFIPKISLQPCYNISGRNPSWLLLYDENGGHQVRKGVQAALVIGLFQYNAERFSADIAYRLTNQNLHIRQSNKSFEI